MIIIIDYEFNKNFVICQKNFYRDKLNLIIQILLNRISSCTCISISLLNNNSVNCIPEKKPKKDLHCYYLNVRLKKNK